MTRMTRRGYQEAIGCLNGLQSNYANVMAVRASGERRNMMNLWEMEEWSRRLGYGPGALDRLNVIHITGTKGKGSTAAFVQGIVRRYRAAGRVGLYTSPHLRSVRERIRIDGEPVSEEQFSRGFFEVWDRLEATRSDEARFPHMGAGAKPGYFKFLTLLSFHMFLEAGCETCVYEVGVGGAFDSTNIVRRPSVCGVTALGIDHTFMLGDTIEEIAWNKGGIFKAGARALTVAGQPPAGLAVLRERAAEAGTALEEVPVLAALRDVKLGIAGDFQAANASLAVALAAEHLRRRGEDCGLGALTAETPLPRKFVEGLEATRWEGRCQTIEDGTVTWYVDGAHTKESIVAASTWFTKVAAPDRRKVLLFNQQTRDAGALLRHLHEATAPALTFDECLFTTNVTWKSGTYSADLVSHNTSKEEVSKLEVQRALQETWSSLPGGASSSSAVYSDIESAVAAIKSIQDPVDVFVTGSLHLVGGLLVVMDGK
ncbi:ACR134Wp [Eremothecium gossypii ATCC 10895]|uniref:Folylpolyglutamate synthase n=1 Tax=Eremothecium gossypii (strain ATCC 10895 / CBS 109.51 / FGSC 9923 / NRRL Y-1056) TaxID=284811 RepID=Q75BY6_EREGS|nr:ACR134Wp [Eremothecium gossypii ATCC 10895]AAS51360.2 ACR134Wp [Eremothecium gossypii ATCC 10895]AEY95651.1 FACR134Wp [Eremothecium gossypii FDAG1]